MTKPKLTYIGKLNKQLDETKLFNKIFGYIFFIALIALAVNVAIDSFSNFTPYQILIRHFEIIFIINLMGILWIMFLVLINNIRIKILENEMSLVYTALDLKKAV